MYVPCTYCINTVLLISSSPVSCEGLPGFSLIWLRMLRQTCSWMSQTRKTATRVGNTRIRANLCECLCECGRGPTNLAANLAANVDAATNPYECLRMLAALQMWLRMWVNVASPTNVVNFASICDKKNVCGCVRMSGGGFVFLCASGHEKSGKFSRFSVLSFEVMISYSGSA